MLALGLALCSAGTAVSNRFSTGQTADDSCSASAGEAKFAPLRPYLKGVDRVGYLAGKHPNDQGREELEHSQARYALVPTVVCGHPNKPIVVANFDSDQELELLLHTGEFGLIARVAPGLAVLRRTVP